MNKYTKSFTNYDVLVTLKKLVDKATPKKPIHCYIFEDVEKVERKGIRNFKTYRCSVCNGIVNNKNHRGEQMNAYCPFCGQAIDWEK